MKKIYKLLLIIITFLLPLLVLSAFMDKNFDLKNLVYGIEEVSIIEDFTELKEVLKFQNFEFSWSWDTVEEIFALILDIIRITFELLVIDPLILIIEIYNLLFT